MITENEKKELHKILLEIMEYIHEVCCENNIQYFLAGGTLLGAIRHNGFIPWDYDVDIHMTRENYIKFENVLINKNDSRFKYCSYKNEKDYYKPHATVVKKHTLYYNFRDAINRELKCNYGIFVDIIPLDYAVDFNDAKAIKRKVHFFRRIVSLKKGFSSSQNECKLKKIIRFIIRLSLSPLPLSFINMLLDKVMQSSNGKKCSLLLDSTSRYKVDKACWDKKLYETTQLHVFEGHHFLIPEGYHEILSIIYGDYNVFPSKEVIDRESYFIYKISTK